MTAGLMLTTEQADALLEELRTLEAHVAMVESDQMAAEQCGRRSRNYAIPALQDVYQRLGRIRDRLEAGEVPVQQTEVQP